MKKYVVIENGHRLFKGYKKYRTELEENFIFNDSGVIVGEK